MTDFVVLMVTMVVLHNSNFPVHRMTWRRSVVNAQSWSRPAQLCSSMAANRSEKMHSPQSVTWWWFSVVNLQHSLPSHHLSMKLTSTYRHYSQTLFRSMYLLKKMMMVRNVLLSGPAWSCVCLSNCSYPPPPPPPPVDLGGNYAYPYHGTPPISGKLTDILQAFPRNSTLFQGNFPTWPPISRTLWGHSKKNVTIRENMCPTYCYANYKQMVRDFAATSLVQNLE